MFGIKSFGVWSAYLLCILSTLACLLYGILNWNKGADSEESQIKEEMKWQEAENVIEENL